MFSSAGTKWISSRDFLYAASAVCYMCVVLEVCGMVLRSYRSHSSGFAYYTNLVVSERPEPAVICPMVVIELATMALVRFLLAAERGRFWFHFSDPQMGKRWCGVLVLLSSGFRRLVDYYSLRHSSLVSLMIPAVFFGHIIAQRKLIGRSLPMGTGGFHSTLPTGTGTTLLRWLFFHAGGVHWANRLYAAQDLIWVVLIAEQRSLASAVAYAPLPSQVDFEAVHPPSDSSIMLDDCNVYFDAEGALDPWDI